MFRPVTVLVAFLVVLSGCAAQDTPEPGTAADVAEPAAGPAKISDTTGGIEGIVVDESINPIPNAQVGLQPGELTTLTDASGAFSFSELAPGTYTLFAGALGHESKGTTVEVVAGEVATARFTLTTVAIAVAFPTTMTFTGLIECGWGLSSAGTGNCLPIQFVIDQFDLPNPTNTRTTGQYAVSEPDKVKQGIFEMIWEPSAATTASELRLLVEAEDSGAVGGTQYGDVDGTSPLRVVTDDEPFKDIDPATGGKVQTRTFPAARLPPTTVANQRFTIYATFCYNAECADGYSVIPDE